MSRCWHVLLLFAGVTHGLKESIGNVDTDNPIIFEPPPGGTTKPGDRFGQGVAIKEGVAIIGAPKSDIHGNIFKCTFDGTTTNSNPIVCEKLKGLCFFSISHMIIPLQLQMNYYGSKMRAFISQCFSPVFIPHLSKYIYTGDPRLA